MDVPEARAAADRAAGPVADPARKLVRIVATVGPSCRDSETLRRMILAGADVFRMNFSHGNYDEHEAGLAAIREAARSAGRTIAVLQDLCGPKIRVGAMAGG